MATLQSPGVQVNVIDESFYTPAAPGTVPMIFVASAENKMNASGTGIALGTTPDNVGKVWTITSQRDLVDTFGTPKFYTDLNGNPINGGEQNEYGLQAAYSYLGVSSRVYIARGDVDLSKLTATSSEPVGAPVAGTYWVDTNDSFYGIHVWDAVAGTFIRKVPLVINNDNKTAVAAEASGEWTPNDDFGVFGDYAMVVTSETTNTLWVKILGVNWVRVGSSAWSAALPTAVGTTDIDLSSAAGKTFTVNGHVITIPLSPTVTNIVSAINSALPNTAKVINDTVQLFGNSIEIVSGTLSVSNLGLSEGTFAKAALAMQPHTQIPSFDSDNNATGSVYIKTTAPGAGAKWSVKYYNGSTSAWVQSPAPIYTNKQSALFAMDSAGGKNIPAGTLFIETDYNKGTPSLAQFKLYRRTQTGATVISATANVTSFGSIGSFTIAATNAGSANYSSDVTISISKNDTLSLVASKIRSANIPNVTADVVGSVFTIRHLTGGDIKLVDGDSTPLNLLGFSAYNIVTQAGTVNLYAAPTGFVATNWKPLVYEAKDGAPFTKPEDNTIWYSSVVDQVDIMYHDGSKWVGYLSAFSDSDPAGPLVKAVAPTTQSDGTALVTGDIWIDTGDIDQYGQNIYVWSQATKKWVKQDPTDQESQNGWVFADARWATAGSKTTPSTIAALLSSDYVDPDAPDPALYPKGTRLWNLRRSGFNIKKYVSNHIDLTANNGTNPRYIVGTGNNAAPEPLEDGANTYATARWITVSPNQPTGAGTFGAHAQRGVVVASLKKLIDTTERLRDTDTVVFNLIACPGYIETTANMIGLNVDRKQTALVVADTPFTLPPNGTAISEWGNNVNNAFDNGTVGAVSNDEFMAMFYPSGYTTDNTGNYIVVPPSHMILRTIANSDNKSYPWYAPAGTRRGSVDNATSVGYLLNGEFKPTPLHSGLRDVLYADARINPIATFPGVGIVNYGQKTRAKNASAMDRINVVRLVAYLRRQLDILARPYIFEQNDQTTRNELKAAVESLMLELVTLRAIYDFVVVCDESNNTPARVDRNELWLDVAIEPMKSVEFIYIPMRLKNTGDIAAGL